MTGALETRTRRSSAPLVVVALVLVLAVIVVGARVLGARSVTASVADVEAKARAAGIVNRLTVVNMLDARVMVVVSGVDSAQWGLTPPDDEPPAGLQATVIDPHRVSPEAGLRPLRIEDGGGDATFTLDVLLDDAPTVRTPIGRVPTRSTSLEYCPPTGRKCVDGYAYFDWQDAPDPALDVFRMCVVDERVIGTYVDGSGARRDVHALFQCDASRFRSTLVLHD